MILTLAMIAAAIGGLVTLGFGIAYAMDPETGLKLSNHRRAQLTTAMLGRYIGFTVLALAAAAYGDPLVILVLFVVFAGISFFDAFVYSSEGHPWLMHAVAGGLCFVVIALSGIAYISGY